MVLPFLWSGLKGASARGVRSSSDYRFRGWSIP